MFNLDALRDSLVLLLKNPGDVRYIRAVTDNYNLLETEMKTTNNYLIPINKYSSNIEKLDLEIKNLLEEIDVSQKNFKDKLIKMKSIYKIKNGEILRSFNHHLDHFNNLYKSIKRNKEEVKLTHMYKYELIKYD